MMTHQHFYILLQYSYINAVFLLLHSYMFPIHLKPNVDGTSEEKHYTNDSFVNIEYCVAAFQMVVMFAFVFSVEMAMLEMAGFVVWIQT